MPGTADSSSNQEEEFEMNPKLYPSHLQSEIERRVSGLAVPVNGYTPDWFRNLRSLHSLLRSKIKEQPGLVIEFEQILLAAPAQVRKVWMYREIFLEVDNTLDILSRNCSRDEIEFGVIEPSIPEAPRPLRSNDKTDKTEKSRNKYKINGKTIH